MMQKKMRYLMQVMAVTIIFLAGLSLTEAGEMKGKMEMEMKMPPGRVMGMSKYNFDETISRLKEAIESQSMMVVFTADHQAMLKMVGMETKGMMGIEFFHPRYGKVIFQNDHMAGVETPLRIVVMESEMGTMFTYWKPSHTFAPYPKLKDLGRELDGVLESITKSVNK
ncbi:MAG: DUF302 domain-containing protein [Nitrospirae bacterium]|nr:DUF302 domain-containing protein [Nitrospirota bacterium]